MNDDVPAKVGHVAPATTFQRRRSTAHQVLPKGKMGECVHVCFSQSILVSLGKWELRTAQVNSPINSPLRNSTAQSPPLAMGDIRYTFVS